MIKTSINTRETLILVAASALLLAAWPLRASETDGVVTLSGTAKNAAEKSLVTKLATDINGVTNVINNMTIEVTAASK